jgi:hypothetical protein
MIGRRDRESPSRLGPATVAQWREAYDASPDATYFHSPMWGQVWEVWSGGRFRVDPRLLVLADGGSVVVGFTRQRTRTRGQLLHLSPGGVYGGWVGPEPLDVARTREAQRAIARLPNLVWRPPAGAGVVHHGGARAEETFVIDLRDGAAVAHGRWHRSARRQATRATREGCTFRRGDGPDDWARYDRIYRRAIERWQRPSTIYDARFFDALVTHGGEGVTLWLVESAGRTVAGAVVLLSRRHAAYWHGASVPAEAPGAANLLHWEIITALAERGCETYDLNPSGGHAGVERFKRTLGATSVGAPLIATTSWRARMIDRFPVARLGTRQP